MQAHFAALMLAATLVSSLTGATLRVPQDFATPQEAVDASRPGDEVILAPGDHGDLLRIVDRRVSIQAASGEAQIDRVFLENSSVRLEGLSGRVGASESSLEVHACHLTTNEFTGLSATRMHVLQIHDSTVTTRDNLHAIRLQSCGRVLIEGCTVEGGSSTSGVGHPALWFQFSQVNVHDSTLVVGRNAGGEREGTALEAHTRSTLCLQNVDVTGLVDLDESSLQRCPANFIQQAIDNAAAGDEVVIPPGVYYEWVRFGGKNITLRSQNPEDPLTVAATVIEAPGGFGPSDAAVNFSGTESESCFLEGFTIRDSAGGVDGRGTHSTIVGNVIDSCFPYGIRACHGLIVSNEVRGNTEGLRSCHGTIRGNLIVDNGDWSAGPTQRGGGVVDCDGLIESNTIQGNAVWHFSHLSSFLGEVSLRGGGLHGCDGVIRNNVIADNQAILELYWLLTEVTGPVEMLGAGLAECHGLIEHNTIYGNVSVLLSEEAFLLESLPPIVASGGGLWNCQGTVRNNIIWGNMASSEEQVAASSVPTHSIIQDWSGGGEGNMRLDPMLRDPVGGDFHLRPESPAIDSASASEVLADFEGDMRPQVAAADIGADEHVGLGMGHIIAHLLGRITLAGENLLAADANGDDELDVSDAVTFQQD